MSLAECEEARRVLAESEEKFRIIADSTTNWECWFGPDGKHVWVNPAVERFTGYSPAEILAMPDFISTVVAVEDLGMAVSTLESALRGSCGENLEIRCLHRNGRKFWLSVSWQPVYDQSGNSLGVRCSGTDITELKSTEEALRTSESRFRSYFELPLHGKFITSLDKGWVAVNDRLCEILGYSHEEIVTKTWVEMTHPDDLAADMAEFERLLAGEISHYRIEKRFFRKDGRVIWTELSVGCVRKPDGTVDHMVGVLDDISQRRRTADALKQNHAMIVKLTSQVPGVVYQYRLFPDGRSAFPFSSPGIADIYEVTPEEVREDATPVFARLHSLDRDRVVADIQESARTLAHFRCDFRVDLPQQGLRWRHCEAVPERTEDGGTLWYGIITDITDRKRAEEELQNLRIAVEQSENTIVITDAQGKIEYVNPAFEVSTGYSKEEAMNQSTRILNAGEQSAGFYRHMWATITSGQTWRGQFHNRRKDGTLYWESATISPVHNPEGEIVHYIAIKEDITDRKSLEANLLDALDRAESANRAKSEFLAVMSHELRTPLNGILGFAELLSDTPLDPEQLEFSRIISSSGNHLLGIVNDILDFSSVEKGSMRIESIPIRAAEVVEDSLRACRKAAADKGLDLHGEASPGSVEMVQGDARRIRQILINLLGNAVKFTSRGHVILRTATACENARSYLDFSVEDTGPGIPADAIDRLFKPFSQADSTMHRSFEGTGLGLAISKRLAEAMGGSIRLDSTPGKGSKFTLRLPAAKFLDQPPATSRRPAAADLPNPASGLILVVEDDRSNSVLAGKMLEAIGYQTAFAINGQKAVEEFSPGKFLAILMDMQMPVMDGLEATKKIREIERHAGGHVRIVALTANVMPGDRERCLAVGMDDFLTKPFRKSELEAKLAGL